MRNTPFDLAKQELCSLWILDRQIDAKIEEKKRISDRLFSLTGCMTEPVSGTKESGFSSGVAELIDMQTQLDKDIKVYIKRRCSIVKRIHSLGDKKISTVLYYRYVLGMSEYETSCRLHYSNRHARRLINKGISLYAEKFMR